MQEEKRAYGAHFVTLTYDTDHVPLTQNGYMTLDKKNVQDFMKRLRKHIHSSNPKHGTKYPIKYYCAGEYGGRTKRPHYHLILFNIQSPLDVDRTWGLGNVHFGAVSGASIGYTLKYLDKQSRIPSHRNDDRTPEFALMSKGIGSNYITPEIIAYHTADLPGRVCLSIEHGKIIAMPRYYKDKIYQEEQRQAIAWHGQRMAEANAAKQFQEYTGTDWYKDQVEQHKNQFRKLKSSSDKRDKL